MGIYGRIAVTVMRRARAWAWAIAATVVAAGILAARIHVDPNILDLLPPDDPTTIAIQQLNREEGGANLLVIGVRPEDPEADDARERADAYMRELAAALRGWPEVDYVLYDIDEDLAWRIGLLQLTPEELRTIRDRLRGALSMGEAMLNPFLAARLLDLGPLTKKLSAGNLDPVLTRRGGVARLVVRPVGSAYDPRFARPFMAKVHALLAEHPPEERGLRLVWIGGAYRHSVEDLEGIVHDLRWTAGLSALLVLSLVAFAYRDPRALLLIFVPLSVGTAWAAAFTGVFVGTLNTFTSFAGALLIGLGVDFSIHLYSRYREERLRGGTLEEAVARAWDRAGPPCLTAALTSAAGFAALRAAGFRGFRQLGTILSAGVLLCLAAVLVTLPLLIAWRERRPRVVPLRELRLPERQRPPTYRWAPLGLLLAGVVTASAALLLPRIGFEYDLSELRRRGLAYEDLSEEERSVAEEAGAPVVVSFPDAESLARAHERLSRAVADGRIPEFGRVLSIHTVIPTDQEERLAILREIAELARRPEVRYLPAQVQRSLARIATADLRPLRREDLPRSLLHLLGGGEGRHRLIVLARGNMWDLRNCVRLREAVERWLPGRPAAGDYLASARLYEMVRGDAPRVAGLALLAVFLVSLLDLRSPGRAIGAISALVAGMCWAGAALVFAGVKLSLVNIVGVPILMGIGVDVIIHLLHRLDEEGPGRTRWALATTGWAAGLSALTTVLSFASLTAASSQGVRSLGLLIVIGLSLVTLAGFVVVPLAWQTGWKLRGELPDTWPPPEGADGGRR